MKLDRIKEQTDLSAVSPSSDSGVHSVDGRMGLYEYIFRGVGFDSVSKNCFMVVSVRPTGLLLNWRLWIPRE